MSIGDAKQLMAGWAWLTHQLVGSFMLLLPPDKSALGTNDGQLHGNDRQ